MEMAEEVVVAEQTAPLLHPDPNPSSGDPSVEVRLYRRGTGPVAVFRSCLVGPSRDRLDVRAIQARHGLRGLYAFKPAGSERGFRIRPGPVGRYSAIPFRDGAVIFLDGEPKESLMKSVAVIVVAVLVPAILVAVAVKGIPNSLRSSREVNGLFPPWILAGAIIIFARMRTRPRIS